MFTSLFKVQPLFKTLSNNILSNTPNNQFRIQARFASKKSGGSTQNGRTSNPHFMGLKLQHNAQAKKGSILIRQRGTKFHPGENVGIGRDFTLFALKQGKVSIHYDLKRQRNTISVDATDAVIPKSKVKEQLRNMVQVESYLKMNSKERYEYVMGLVDTLDAQKPVTVFPKPRTCLDLKDLTLQ